ncbi:MAG: protein-arginine deiminase family protein [Candidatus Altimarinota bacterium]
MGYHEGMDLLGFIQTAIKMVTRTRPKIPLMVLVPRLQMDQAKRDLSSYIPSQDRDLIRFVQTPSETTVWAQDYFEQAIDEFGMPQIIDLPHFSQLGEHIPTAVALSCNMNLISQANVNVDDNPNASGNFGGNIEALTDGLVAVGNSMGPEQKDILKRDLGQKLVELNVHWLKVKHVDEIISLIPVPERGGTCPFDLLYVSPGQALQLIQTESQKSGLAPVKLRHGFGAQEVYFNLWDCFDKSSSHPGCVVLKQANRSYEKIMKKNIEVLRAALTKESPDCKAVRFVPIPVLFTSSQVQTKFGTNQDLAISLDPNPVNNVLIHDEMLLPKQKLPVLHYFTASQIAPYKLKTTFVDSAYLHHFDGGLHCSLNVRHTCRPRSTDVHGS